MKAFNIQEKCMEPIIDDLVIYNKMECKVVTKNKKPSSKIWVIFLDAKE